MALNFRLADWGDKHCGANKVFTHPKAAGASDKYRGDGDLSQGRRRENSTGASCAFFGRGFRKKKSPKCFFHLGLIGEEWARMGFAGVRIRNAKNQQAANGYFEMRVGFF